MDPSCFTLVLPKAKNQHAVPEGHVAMKKIDRQNNGCCYGFGLEAANRSYDCWTEGTSLYATVLDTVMRLKIKLDSDAAQVCSLAMTKKMQIQRSGCKHLLGLEKVVSTRNNTYIITQYCSGRDLKRLVRKRGGLPEREAQSVMKQVVKGMEEVFRLGIVHRDLKLANIFICKDVIKIADFGFSIPLNRCGQPFSYNVGSPEYMPPESLKFNRYSHLTDIWSVGVLAFELIYGKVPWKSRNEQVILSSMLSEPIAKILAQSSPQISEPYKNFIRSCLSLDPLQRMNLISLTNFNWPMANDNVLREFIRSAQDDKKNFQGHKVAGPAMAKQNSAKVTKDFPRERTIIKVSSSEKLIQSVDMTLQIPHNHFNSKPDRVRMNSVKDLNENNNRSPGTPRMPRISPLQLPLFHHDPSKSKDVLFRSSMGNPHSRSLLPVFRWADNIQHGMKPAASQPPALPTTPSHRNSPPYPTQMSFKPANSQEGFNVETEQIIGLIKIDQSRLTTVTQSSLQDEFLTQLHMCRLFAQLIRRFSSSPFPELQSMNNLLREGLRQRLKCSIFQQPPTTALQNLLMDYQIRFSILIDKATLGRKLEEIDLFLAPKAQVYDTVVTLMLKLLPSTYHELQGLIFLYQLLDLERTSTVKEFVKEARVGIIVDRQMGVAKKAMVDRLTEKIMWLGMGGSFEPSKIKLEEEQQAAIECR